MIKRAPNIFGFSLGIIIHFVFDVFAAHGLYPGSTTSEILSMPYGSRQIAMGEIGAATAINENASSWNPALFGIRNPRWQYGALSYQFEKPFPMALWDENRHHSFSLCFQPKNSPIGTFALSANIHNRGTVIFEDYLGRELGRGQTSEGVYGITWGFGFHELGIDNHLYGITVKYLHSAIAPGFGPANEGVGRCLVFDAGYSWLITSMFTLGFSLQNMGSSLFYIAREDAEPLPFKGNLALGFSRDFAFSEWILNRIVAEYKLSRFFVKMYSDKSPDRFFEAIVTSWQDNTAEENWRSLLHNFGYEITILKYLHLRQGFYIDPRFDEAEMHWGFGGTIFNHFEVDFHHIYSPKTTEYRNGQWGLSFTTFRLWNWK